MTDADAGVPGDSAGVPWAGRSFDAHPASTDDGSAPSELLEILATFRSGGCTGADVLDVLRDCRLLVPLVAQLAGDDSAADARHGDKSAELGIVTVAAPDGRRVLPVFSSVDSLKVWNTDARPVPSDAVRVALAAASENTELVVLDPGSVTEFVVRRPAVWALAQGLPWVPSYLDEEVLAAFVAAAEPETSVAAVLLDSGDPAARLSGPELTVTIAVRPGLVRGDIDALLDRLGQRFASNDLITARVDSIGVRVVDSRSIDADSIDADSTTLA